MIYTIHKGKHRSWPFIFGLHVKPWMERDVVFDDTAAYDLPGNEDDSDVNKLFGFGYLNGGHHKDSARFGWNYNNESGRINLFVYCYVNGNRIIQHICSVLPYHKVRLRIAETLSGEYWFAVHDGVENWNEMGFVRIPYTHNKKIRYKLGCFFGGNNPAPQDIKIKISKK
jgi:hypothetical protein